MKKFYTLLAVAAVALSASAANRSTSVEKLPIIKADFAGIACTGKADLTSVKSVRKAPAKAASVADFVGDYTWNNISLLSGGAPSNVSIKMYDASTGEVEIDLGGMCDVIGTIDAAAGTLTIRNKQYVFNDSDGPVYFYIKEVQNSDVADGASSAASTVGEWNGVSFVFPELDIWALGDPAQEDLGWYFMTYVNEFESGSAWTAQGNGAILENFLSTLFGITNTEYVQVDVYESSVATGLYKVVDPFKAFYAANGLGSVSPNMMIDATNPDNVLIELQSTGLSTQQLGSMYYFNEGWYSAEYGDELDPSLACTLTEDAGQVTITIPGESCLIYTPNSTTGYNFYVGEDVDSYIKFVKPLTGVTNVAAENDANAPVEFFNLQGVRVANPEAGQLVIRRQGASVEKVVIR